MADTAEIVRDREPETEEGGDRRPTRNADQDTTTPPSRSAEAGAPTFPDLASEITQNRAAIEAARKRRDEAVAREQAGLEQRAAKMGPAITQAEQAIQAPAPPPPAPLQLTPPPSRQLTDFLAPVQGESPQNTIAKVIQGIGLLATGFTGMQRGTPKAALASLSGALKGWHEGDKERADRAFADWEAQSDKLIKEHASRHKRWQDILEDKRLTMEQAMKFLELEGLRDGYDRAAGTFAKQSIEESMKFMQEDQKQLLTLQDHRQKLIEQHAEKERGREFQMAMAQIKDDKKEERRQEVLANYQPGSPALTALAWKTISDGGRVPNIGMAGPVGQEVRGLVLKEVGRLMTENNIPLSSLPGIGAEMKGWQTNINTAARNLAYWNANIGTFHDHVKQFLKLSEGTERGQSPAVNRYALKARGQYAGDAEVAAYEAMANEVAAEYAKLSVGTAQGDANSREEARQKINPAMNPEQIRRVMEELVQAGENRKRNWESAMKQGVEAVSSFGGRISHPLPPSGGPQPGDLVWDAAAKKLVPVK